VISSCPSKFMAKASNASALRSHAEKNDGQGNELLTGPKKGVVYCSRLNIVIYVLLAEIPGVARDSR
jgi:hypothetical protein